MTVAATGAGNTSVTAKPTNELRDGALALAARGMRVFPLEAHGKRPQPSMTNWGAKATANGAQIKQWWTWWPDANIGLPTGAGRIVIDLDSADAESTLGGLEQQHGTLPTTLTATTGRGTHLYFAVPDGVTIRNVQALADHIDVRGDGGYVVAPPSVHESGVEYAWLRYVPVAQLPDTWVELLREQRERQPVDLGDDSPIPIGQQNEEIFRRISKLRGQGRDIAEARIYARGLNVPNDPGREPWTDNDLDAIVERVYATYEAGEQPAAVRHTTQPDNDTVDRSPLAQLRAALFTVDQLADRPQQDPLIDGWLDRNSLVTIYGESGSGKSFVALDIALSVATGRNWADRATARGLVLYVAAEGSDGMHERCLSWMLHNGRTSPDVHVLATAVTLFDKAWADALAALTGELQPALVVIDTLARSMPGGNENSAQDMAAVIDATDRIRRASSACVALVHHSGWNTTRERGSTALRGAMDSMIEVKRDGDRVTLKATKQRYREDGATVRFLSTVVGKALAFDLDTRDLSTAKPLTASAQRALDALKASERPLRPSDWLPLTGLQERTFYYALDSLKASNVIVVNEDGCYAPC